MASLAETGYPWYMSTFKVDLVARNIKDETRLTPPVEVVVDSGSELSWLPGTLLDAAGISPRKHSTFKTATGEVVYRAVGYVILAAGDFECPDEVVFAEPGDMSLLGVRTIEGFGVDVDYIAHRFVARTMLVAAAG
jgi:predicted aspartyl protease